MKIMKLEKQETDEQTESGGLEEPPKKRKKIQKEEISEQMESSSLLEEPPKRRMKIQDVGKYMPMNLIDA